MFLFPLQPASLPSVSSASSLLRDCLGYGPFSLHTPSLRTTCSPRRLNLFILQGSRAALSWLCFALTSRRSPRRSRSACRWSPTCGGCRISEWAASGPAGKRGKVGEGVGWSRFWGNASRDNHTFCLFVAIKHLLCCRLLFTGHHDQPSALLVIFAKIFDPWCTQSS